MLAPFSRSGVFLGALSFEERCIAAFTECVEATPGGRGVFLDYGNQATPGSEAAALRAHNWARVEVAAKRASWRVERRSANPYSMGAVLAICDALAGRGAPLCIDVSCLTRPHVLAAARAATRASVHADWQIAYTSPLAYGDLVGRGVHGGWRDTLLLPLGDDPNLENEGLSLGLVLLGYEADRAFLALSEFEPAAGVILSAYTPGRPDFDVVVRKSNADLVSYLTSLTMPGPRAAPLREFLPDGGWIERRVSLDDGILEFAQGMRLLLDAASSVDAPILLFPFGPKLFVFLAGTVLAGRHGEASWACYPVPRTHPLNYSEGIRRTTWISARLGLESLAREHHSVD